MAETLLYSIEDETTAVVTINRPESLNALNRQVVSELAAVMESCKKDDSLRAVIITGSGNKAFMAGADIKEMQGMGYVEALEFLHGVRELFDMIERFPKPVIAAVNGLALGGGCELALACDLRIAAEGAVFGQPEINVGIMPGAGGTQRLPRLIGPARAKELLFTGDTIDARTALGMGLVNKVVPPGVLLAESRELAKKIAHKSPLIIGLIKQAVNTGLDCPLPAGLSFELQCCAFLFGTEDRNEGMSAFVERRKPVFKGR